MTHIPNYMPAPQPIPGRAGLIAFGIVSIVIGALAGCGSLTMPMVLLMARAGAPQSSGLPLATMILITATYAIVAVSFIWVGIGSCRCQHWVRPLILAIAWPSLVFGILLAIFAVPMMISQQSAAFRGGPTMPPAARLMMQIATAAFALAIYVGIPAGYVIFYQRRRVAEVLAQCDPLPRWTDRCPTPVLGLAIWSAFAGVGMLAMLQSMRVPVFGFYFTGTPAVLVTVALSLTMLLAAWLCYRLRPVGWWLALLIPAIVALSTLTTLTLTGATEFYRDSHLSAAQMVVVEQSRPRITGFVIAGAYLVAWVGWLLYVRRYFVARPAPPPVPPETA